MQSDNQPTNKHKGDIVTCEELTFILINGNQHHDEQKSDQGEGKSCMVLCQAEGVASANDDAHETNDNSFLIDFLGKRASFPEDLCYSSQDHDHDDHACDASADEGE